MRLCPSCGRDILDLLICQLVDEEPVLLPHSGGTDGIFDQVRVDLQAAVVEVEQEGAPLLQSIVDRFAHRALRQIAMFILPGEQQTVQPLHDGSRLQVARHRSELRTSSGLSQVLFEPVKILHEVQDEANSTWAEGAEGVTKGGAGQEETVAI